jgi:flavin reductase (DIM6/NTAB) family NADH-FMN oxidoreductase RutF
VLALQRLSDYAPSVLLQALTTKEKIAHMKASMSADVAKAMGRLSSGLYIVAAQQENARRQAQSASFISVQASPSVISVQSRRGPIALTATSVAACQAVH